MKNRTVKVMYDEYIFAKNLETLRKSQKPLLSQKRLAERLGVCRTTYNNYERGERQAPAFFIANVARYFSVDVDKLLNEALWKE